MTATVKQPDLCATVHNEGNRGDETLAVATGSFRHLSHLTTNTLFYFEYVLG
jgi:hypothetical protein